MIGMRRSTSNVVAAVLGTVYLLPLAWVLLTALKSDEQMRGGANALVFTPTLEVFGDILGLGGRATVTSAIIAVSTTVIVLLIGVPAAYALARIPNPLWGRVVAIVLGGLLVLQMVPQSMAVIPLFGVLARWGQIGTVTGVVLADVALLAPFAILLLRPFVRSIPGEVFEAAELDGASGRQVFGRIVVPLVANGIATVGAIVFILAWGEFIYATTFLTDPSQLPVSGLLAQQTSLYSVSWNRMMALAVLTSLPLIVVFAAAQRLLVQGLSVGAVK